MRDDPAGNDAAAICSDLIRFDTTNRGEGAAAPERPAAEHVAALLAGAGAEPGSSSRRRDARACWPGSPAPIPAIPRS